MTPRHAPLALAVCAILVGPATLVAQDVRSPVRNSSEMPGFPEPVYDGTELTSLYITMDDGVRLAADIFRPTLEGEVETEPLPVILIYNRYHRAVMRDGERMDGMTLPFRRAISSHGYIFVDVDVRGAGASFGTDPGPLDTRELEDLEQVIDWVVARPWCDGNLGMYGGSYLGAAQFMGAAVGAPHVKAIMPRVAPADIYSAIYMGGIYRHDFLRGWTGVTEMLATQIPPAPVQGPEGPALLEEARQLRSRNRDTLDLYEPRVFRDARDDETGDAIYYDWSPIWMREAIEDSGVAIYHVVGWFDIFTRDGPLMFANLDNPQRMAIGPWFHRQSHEFDLVGETVRWFDYWLKGVDNGIMDEPPVHYFRMSGGPDAGSWVGAEQWPPASSRPERYILTGDGDPHARVTRAPADAPASHLQRTADYSATTGESTRYTNAYGGPMGYADLAPNDAKGFTFTTEPLAEPLVVTGHPLAELWVSTNGPDVDIFVYLEHVSSDGVSSYVTEGQLRASRRASHEAPLDTLGMPWRRHHKQDVLPVPPIDEPMPMDIEMQPTSYEFPAGSRVRLTVTMADEDNFLTPVVEPAPDVRIWLGAEHASAVILPIERAR